MLLQLGKRVAGTSSLAGRLTRAALESTALALLVACLAMNVLVYGWSRATLRGQAQVQAAIASDGVGPALLFGDAKAAGETLRLLASSPDIRRATVFDGAGHVFAEYDVTTDQMVLVLGKLRLPFVVKR